MNYSLNQSSSTLLSVLSLYVLFFSVYSFTGWFLEFCFRTIIARHFVNPGFLKGPFLPIYGTFTLLVIATERLLHSFTLGWHFLFFTVVSTGIEYFTGLYFLHYYHIQLWDYSEIPFNYKGLIALPFSLAWGALGLLFKFLLHPPIKHILSLIPSLLLISLASLLGIYFIWDLTQSSCLMHRFNDFIDHFHERSEELEDVYFEKMLCPFRRFLKNYPKLRQRFSESVNTLHERNSSNKTNRQDP